MEAMQTQGDVRTGVEMALVCWTCGAKKTILVGKKPEFGIEFGHIVERGLVGVQPKTVGSGEFSHSAQTSVMRWLKRKQVFTESTRRRNDSRQ